MNKFQFHTGSIKSLTDYTKRELRLSFQFHTGSIKRPLSIMPRFLMFSFNSILVRLKVKHNNDEMTPYIEFQFHTGSIKSLRRILHPRMIYMFQFHTGSIKSVVAPYQVLVYVHVSIPYWFD